MLNSVLSIEINNQRFSLLPEKAIFWHNESCILLSDIHAGKAGHFRKYGIPLSSDIMLHDLLSVENLLERYKAERIIILGDLFHSEHNDENSYVFNWLQSLSIPYLLVEGNHDIHSISNYDIRRAEKYETEDFIFCHEEVPSCAKFSISGHLHPAYVVSGKARQQIKLPCFWQKDNALIMPAFGSLTGLKRIKPGKGDKVFLVSEGRIIAI